MPATRRAKASRRRCSPSSACRARPTWSRRATASCRPSRSAAPTRRAPIALPPDAAFGITDCYIKPYACCRHIQPAVEALFGLLNDEKIAADDISHVDVETYRIAAEHAHTGWDDYASAQLCFPYLMGVAARFRGIKVKHFNAETRTDPAFAEFASKLTITAPPEIDGLYPKLRPARVTVTTPRGKFVRQADEALGSRIVPLDDAGLEQKFIEMSSRCSAQRAPRRWCGSSGTSRRSPTSGRWSKRRRAPEHAGHQDRRLHRHRQHGPPDGGQSRQGRLSGRRL